MNYEDAIEILELEEGYTEEDLKKQYRCLALQYHPDKNHSEGATKKFQEIKGKKRKFDKNISVACE